MFSLSRTFYEGQFLGKVGAYAQKIYIQSSVSVSCPAYNSASVSVWTPVCILSFLIVTV